MFDTELTPEHTSMITGVFAQLINPSDSTPDIELVDGIPHLNLRFISEYIGIRIDHAKNIIKKNQDQFKTFYFEKETKIPHSPNSGNVIDFDEIKYRGGAGVRYDFYLSIAGIALFLSKLNANKYDGEVKQLIDAFQIGTATKVGEQKNIKEIPQLVGKIDSLENVIQKQSEKIESLENTCAKLISQTTINSRQATTIKLFIHEKAQRELGAPRSTYYKEHAKKFFANLYIAIGKEFGVTTYKDLNPLDYENIFSFITDWEYHISEEKSYQTTL